MWQLLPKGLFTIHKDENGDQYLHEPEVTIMMYLLRSSFSG